jgi:hypothetical protein
LEGRWKVSNSPNDVYDADVFAGMFDNVRDVSRSGKYITADIAMKGSNKLVVGYWEGMELCDVEIMDKSDGKQVIDCISKLAQRYNVENRYICYDSDGVGSYIDGFIRGAVPFNGGASAMPVKDEASGRLIKENYFNLKTQCYYRTGDRVSRGEMKISKAVADKMYDSTQTVRQRFMFERKAISRDKQDSDGKLRIVSKEAMKLKLNSDSPDLMDMFMMREIFELKPKIVFAYGNI